MMSSLLERMTGILSYFLFSERYLVLSNIAILPLVSRTLEMSQDRAHGALSQGSQMLMKFLLLRQQGGRGFRR